MLHCCHKWTPENTSSLTLSYKHKELYKINEDKEQDEERTFNISNTQNAKKSGEIFPELKDKIELNKFENVNKRIAKN